LVVKRTDKSLSSGKGTVALEEVSYSPDITKFVSRNLEF